MGNDRLIRRIEARLKELGSNAYRAAVEAGLKRDAIRNVLRGKSENPRRDTLENVARALKWTVNDLLAGEDIGAPEPSHQPEATPPAAARRGEISSPIPVDALYGARDLPLLGFARGGYAGKGMFFDNGAPSMVFTYRPVYLAGARDAYAVIVSGTSMAPRYVNGEMVYADPRRMVKPGDYVVIEQHNGEGFIKQLVRRVEGFVICRQHNPDSEVKFVSEHVKSVHLIVGSTQLVA